MVKPEETDGLVIILHLHCHTSTEISLRGLKIVIGLEEYKFQQAGSEKGKLFAVNCKIKSTRITDQIINATPRCGH